MEVEDRTATTTAPTMVREEEVEEALAHRCTPVHHPDRARAVIIIPASPHPLMAVEVEATGRLCLVKEEEAAPISSMDHPATTLLRSRRVPPHPAKGVTIPITFRLPDPVSTHKEDLEVPKSSLPL